MPILTSDFSSLTDDLQSIFNESAQSAIADMVGNQVFRVMDTDRRTYDHLILDGLDVIQAVAQGSDLPEASSVQGDTATYTQSRYGGLVNITKDMRIFDLWDQMDSLVQSAADDAFHKIDQSMADVLTNGFSSSAYTDVYGASVAATGPDGLALFSASHTNNVNANTYRNLIRYNGSNSPILSREAVNSAIVDALNHLDAVNKNRPVKLDTLLVAPANWDLAVRIAESEKIPGSAENDTNMWIKGRVKVKAWEKMTTRTGGTDSSAYWFMFDSKKVGESLKALFRERPSMDPPEQVYKNKNWQYSIDYYYALGRGLPAYVWGSLGTA